MEPRTDWQETVAEGEAERFERYAEQLRELQRGRAKRRPVSRGLHAKANAGVDSGLRCRRSLGRSCAILSSLSGDARGVARPRRSYRSDDMSMGVARWL